MAEAKGKTAPTQYMLPVLAKADSAKIGAMMVLDVADSLPSFRSYERKFMKQLVALIDPELTHSGRKAISRNLKEVYRVLSADVKEALKVREPRHRPSLTVQHVTSAIQVQLDG